MFFIDDDETEILQRREDRAPGADDNPRPASIDLVPLVVPFALGLMAVQNRHRFLRLAEPALKSLNCLRRERNLRDENDRGFAADQR